MPTTLKTLAKALVALLFASALTIGISRSLTANASLACDTPTGVCTEHEDCDEACLIYNGTEFGGECQSGGCCMCLE